MPQRNGNHTPSAAAGLVQFCTMVYWHGPVIQAFWSHSLSKVEVGRCRNAKGCLVSGHILHGRVQQLLIRAKRVGDGHNKPTHNNMHKENGRGSGQLQVHNLALRQGAEGEAGDGGYWKRGRAE